MSLTGTWPPGDRSRPGKRRRQEPTPKRRGKRRRRHPREAAPTDFERESRTPAGAYVDVFEAADAHVDKMAAAHVATAIPLPHWQQVRRQALDAAAAGGGNRGDARFAAVRRTLGEFRDNDGDLLERSDTQIMFHEHMLNALTQVHSSLFPPPANGQPTQEGGGVYFAVSRPASREAG